MHAPARSCPVLPDLNLPMDAQPDALSRRQTLPPLDFATLPHHLALPDDLLTARRRLNVLSSSLSTVRPHVLIGGRAAARDALQLIRHGVTHIVNLAYPSIPNFHAHDPRFSYLSLSLRDDPREDGIDTALVAACSFASQAFAQGGKVAFVCAQGISRSATCALATLMLSEGIEADRALREVRVTRPIVAPNVGFLEALSRLQTRMYEGRPRDAAFRMCKVNMGRTVFVPRTAEGNGMLEEKDVIVVERRGRGGVIVWVGKSAERDGREAGVRLARVLAQQQVVDMGRFGGREMRVGKVTVCEQGEMNDVEMEVVAAMGR